CILSLMRFPFCGDLCKKDLLMNDIFRDGSPHMPIHKACAASRFCSNTCLGKYHPSVLSADDVVLSVVLSAVLSVVLSAGAVPSSSSGILTTLQRSLPSVYSSVILSPGLYRMMEILSATVTS